MLFIVALFPKHGSTAGLAAGAQRCRAGLTQCTVAYDEPPVKSEERGKRGMAAQPSFPQRNALFLGKLMTMQA